MRQGNDSQHWVNKIFLQGKEVQKIPSDFGRAENRFGIGIDAVCRQYHTKTKKYPDRSHLKPLFRRICHENKN
jgi:hypothetical protein